MGKIVIVSPSLKMGGIERALTVLANYFVEKGHQVIFICCLRSEKFYQLNEKIVVVEPSFKRTNGKLNKVLFYPRLINYLRNNIKKIKPDTILAYGDVFNPLVLLANLGLKTPVYISDRTSPDYIFKFPIPQLKKWLYPTSTGFIAQTENAKIYKEKYFANKLNIRVIPNAIRKVELFPQIERKNTILFLGRFAWEKDPEILIRAFSKISNNQDWDLVMAGSGPLLSPMKQLARDLKIENQVIFLGDVNNVDTLFAEASIFVLPSVLEGFPNSLSEAMAAGLAVISFDTIPYKDLIIPNYNGIVTSTRDSDHLAKDIQKLVNDKEARIMLGKNASLIYHRLNPDIIGQQILDFIIQE